jgi:predicted nucleic acid-binding protein
MGKRVSSSILQSIVSIENLIIKSVEDMHVRAASVNAPQLGLGFNDTIAYLIMLENQLSKIYSFDKDFDKVKDISRIH